MANPRKLPNGRWQVRFPAPDRHRESFDTKKDADAALTKARGDRNEGTYIAPKSVPTFKAVADEWLAGKAGRKPSTLDSWHVHIEVHLKPLHDLRVNQITIAKIESLREALLKDVAETEETPARKKLLAQTVNKVLTTAAAILDRAVRHNWCIKNSASKASVERARIAPNQVLEGETQSRDANRPVRVDEVLNLVEIRRLLDAADPGYYRTLFMTAALTGMRSGELLGLRWCDVELRDNRLNVRRSLSWARVREESEEDKTPERAQPRFFEPKTASSRRTIPLSPELVAALRRWKLQCPKGKDDLVFPSPTSETGAPAHRSNVLKRGLYPALTRAKLRRVDMHSLRHSFASILIAAGTPITEVQALLGHSSAQTTLKVYSHWFRSLNTSSIDTLSKALLGAGEGAGHLVDTSNEPSNAIAVNDAENLSSSEENLVPPAGFEPTAPGLGILCSIHLS
jgi:integrase